MQSVKTKDTGPEWIVRRWLHSRGYRYRLHIRDLPGRPDIVLTRRRLAIFVHGCFWHGHGCRKGKAPKSKLAYWAPKLRANRERDVRNAHDLQAKGWKVLFIWQCETINDALLEQKLLPALAGEQTTIDIPPETGYHRPESDSPERTKSSS
jgi:DNA mismatch endonuclease (patch repair protein)